MHAALCHFRHFTHMLFGGGFYDAFCCEKEKRQHGSMQVPYSYYDCRMPDYFPGVPLHWHRGDGAELYQTRNGVFSV